MKPAPKAQVRAASRPKMKATASRPPPRAKIPRIAGFSTHFRPAFGRFLPGFSTPLLLDTSGRVPENGRRSAQTERTLASSAASHAPRRCVPRGVVLRDSKETVGGWYHGRVRSPEPPIRRVVRRQVRSPDDCSFGRTGSYLEADELPGTLGDENDVYTCTSISCGLGSDDPAFEVSFLVGLWAPHEMETCIPLRNGQTLRVPSAKPQVLQG